MTILQAHDFPVTSLRFNPTADLLISGSADNSVRVITVPPPSERGQSLSISSLMLTDQDSFIRSRGQYPVDYSVDPLDPTPRGHHSTDGCSPGTNSCVFVLVVLAT